MEIIFYSFRKKQNSTARPSGGTSLSVVLKSESSVLSPVIEVATREKPFTYNYAYIPMYDRYYWVTDWTWTVDFWTAQLRVDALASWKDTIGSTPLYVLRSSVSYDGLIGDDMYPTKVAPDVTTFNIEAGLPDGSSPEWFKVNVNYEDGIFILGVVNSSRQTQGAVSYYALESSDLRDLMNYLMDNTDYLDVTTDIASNGIPDNLLKTLYNPFQYIVSCNWFPTSPTSLTSVPSIKYGWWEIPVHAYIIHNNFKRLYGHVNIGYHPQALERGAYLNGSPYTRCTLLLQPFGLIPIDTSRLAKFNQTYITFYMDVDFVSGSGSLRIYNLDGRLQTISSAQIGVPIQLAQMAVDRLTQAETVIAGTADVTRSAFSIKNAIDPVAGAASTVSTTTHAIADGIRSSFPQTQISGANGSTTYTYAEQVVTVEHYLLVDEDNDHNGRPLCQVITPASRGGYLLIRDADVATTGTAEEDAEIRGYLESGFYYE